MARPPKKKQKRRRSLIKEKSLYMSGPVAFVGELSLSKEDLRFVPTRKFERMLGAKVTRIPVDEVREVSVVDLGKKLEVRTDSGVETFLGEGACKVGGRLWALVLEREGKTAEEGGYDAGERIFYSGAVDIHLDRVRSVEAELSDRRLRFLSRRRNKKSAVGRAMVTLPLADIASVEFSVSKRELVLHIREDRTVVFGDPDQSGVRDGEVVESRPIIRMTGGGLPKLYGQLKVLGVGERGVDPVEGDDGEILLDQEKAGLYRGIVAHYGYLVASRQSLNFVPTGKLDGVFGAQPLEILYSDMVDLEIRSDGETRLVVCTKDAEHIFEVRAPMAWFTRMSTALVTSMTNEGAKEGGQLSDDFIHEELEKWSENVTAKMGYGVMIGGPAFSWMSDRALCRGAVVLTQTGALFLPDDGKSSSMLYAPVEVMKRSDHEPEKGDEIVFSANGIGYRFAPAGGVSFTFMFWSRFEQRQRAGDLLEAAVGMKQMMGNAEGVRLKSPKVRDVLTESALIVAISGNIGVVVSAGIPRSYDKGSPVTVEVSKSDGIYRFSTTIARDFAAADLTADVVDEEEKEDGVDDGEEGGEKASVLVLNRPGGIYFQNRRGEFRVFYEEVLVKVICVELPEGVDEWEGLEEYDDDGEVRKFRNCRLLNLSAHGCLLESELKFQPGTRVTLELPVTLGTIDLSAECVRAVPPFGDRVHWAFGFAFGEMRDGYRDRIYRIMYRQQAAEKRSKDRALEDSAAGAEEESV